MNLILRCPWRQSYLLSFIHKTTYIHWRLHQVEENHRPLFSWNLQPRSFSQSLFFVPLPKRAVPFYCRFFLSQRFMSIHSHIDYQSFSPRLKVFPLTYFNFLATNIQAATQNLPSTRCPAHKSKSSCPSSAPNAGRLFVSRPSVRRDWK